MNLDKFPLCKIILEKLTPQELPSPEKIISVENAPSKKFSLLSKK
jgi:hypothetical protein